MMKKDVSRVNHSNSGSHEMNFISKVHTKYSEVQDGIENIDQALVSYFLESDSYPNEQGSNEDWDRCQYCLSSSEQVEVFF